MKDQNTNDNADGKIAAQKRTADAKTLASDGVKTKSSVKPGDTNESVKTKINSNVKVVKPVESTVKKKPVTAVKSGADGISKKNKASAGETVKTTIASTKKGVKFIPAETLKNTKSTANNKTTYEKEMDAAGDNSSENGKRTWWNKKKRSSKFRFIAGIIFAAGATAFIIVSVFSRYLLGTDSFLYKNLGMIANLDVFIEDNSEVILKSFINIAVILLVQKFIRVLIRILIARVKKVKAIINIFDSIVKYAAMLILVFKLLSLWGVDTTTLLAGAGILTLVIGFAAQTLIQDIICGFFIVFEKTFDIDDIVNYNGFRGRIIEIGIRTVKMQDAEGNVLIVNNSDIRSIINMTKDLSIALCKVSIEYEESIVRVEKVILNNLDRIANNVKLIKRGPFYKGVSELGDSGVELLIVAECSENDRFQIIRDMNRELKLIFDENHINIPFPQIVLNNKVKLEKKKNASEQTRN